MKPRPEHDAQLYARSFADVYDQWYGSLDDPAHLLGAVKDRTRPQDTILELGSGTGRLASPLDAAGFNVIALDASMPMLRSAPAGPHTIGADMARLPLRDDSVHVVIVAYNTLFNLTNRAAQQRCFDEAARVLCRGGSFAIEAFVAPPGVTSDFGVSQRGHPTDSATRLTIVSGPDRSDPNVIVGTHIEHGSATTCRPWRLTYQTPAELDRSAHQSGLKLTERSSDWLGTPFDSDDQRHVSWYELL